MSTTLTLDPPQGRSTLPFIDARHPERPLEINFYRPARHRPDDEVVFVQHGMLRNGDDYRDFWIDAAEKHNLLIVAPTFGNTQFPQAEGYNNGLVVGEDGAIAAQDDWLYAVPARVLAALRKAGVTKRDKVRLFGHSAGGQRQRIGIARALAVKPDFLVCDEPVSALDVSIQAQVINLFMDVRARHGLTYLFVSHDLGLVRHISDRVAIMYLGRIVEIGSATAIFAEPAHPYSAALIKAIPSAERRKSSFQPLKGELPSPLSPPSGCPFHPRCEQAMPVCREVRPVLTEIAPGRSAACHLHTTAKAA